MCLKLMRCWDYDSFEEYMDALEGSGKKPLPAPRAEKENKMEVKVRKFLDNHNPSTIITIRCKSMTAEEVKRLIDELDFNPYEVVSNYDYNPNYRRQVRRNNFQVSVMKGAAVIRVTYEFKVDVSSYSTVLSSAKEDASRDMDEIGEAIRAALSVFEE